MAEEDQSGVTPQQQIPAFTQQMQSEPNLNLGPYGVADDLQLNRMMNARASVNEEFLNGNIDAGGHQAYIQQIAPRLDMLQQRKDKATADAEQKQVQAALKGEAQQAMVQQQNMKYAAANFTSGVAVYTDPVSGRTIHAYQKKPGNWEEMTFDAARADQESPEGDPVMQPASGGQAPGQQASVPPMQVLNDKATASGQPIPLDQVGQAMRSQNPNTPLPSIQNALGQNIDQRLIDEGVIKDPRRTASPDALAELHRRAEAAIPQLPANAPDWMKQRRAAQVDQILHKSVENHYRMLDHAQTRKLMDQDHRQKEEAKATEAKRHDDAKALEAKLKREADASGESHFGPKEHLALLNQHQHTLEKEKADFQKNLENSGKPLPEHLQDVGKTAKSNYLDQIKFMREQGVIPAAKQGEPQAEEKKPAVDQQAALVDKILSKVAGNPESQAIKAPSKEELAKPSAITHDKIADVLPRAQEWFNAVPAMDKLTGEFNLSSQPVTHLRQMKDILETAHKEGRGLTKEERRNYETHYRLIQHHDPDKKLALM